MTTEPHLDAPERLRCKANVSGVFNRTRTRAEAACEPAYDDAPGRPGTDHLYEQSRIFCVCELAAQARMIAVAAGGSRQSAAGIAPEQPDRHRSECAKRSPG